MNEQIPMQNLVGKTIGIYQVAQLVEENELGAVYIANSQTSELTYRLRVLRPSSTLTSASRIVFFGQFQQYARELAALLSDDEQMPKHPHLLPLVDYGNFQGIPYLVSLQTPMRQFTELLNTRKTPDTLTIGLYLDQMASALEYAHDHATLHRDLSTDVVYMRDDGKLIIVDLGVMRILELNFKEELQTSLYAHSPFSNPAPEQLLGQPENTYTDVYALGALLYQFLTGHRVYTANSFAEIVEHHLHAPVPSLTEWQKIVIGQRDVTSKLDKLIAAAMTKDTQQRIQHPAELANSYHQIIAPDDTTRQPIISPLALAVAPPPLLPPIARPTKNKERFLPSEAHTAAPTIAARSAQVREARRRTLIFMGGGAVVAVGAVAFIADQLLSKQGIASNGTANQPVATLHGSGQTANSTSQFTQGAVSGNIIARTSAVPLNSAITFKNPNSNSLHPALLVHLSNNQFVAFDSTCTHAGCSVNYNPQDKLLECPCHGAQFDPAKQAAVIQGPATSPLAPLQITIHSDGSITTL